MATRPTTAPGVAVQSSASSVMVSARPPGPTIPTGAGASGPVAVALETGVAGAADAAVAVGGAVGEERARARGQHPLAREAPVDSWGELGGHGGA